MWLTNLDKGTKTMQRRKHFQQMVLEQLYPHAKTKQTKTLDNRPETLQKLKIDHSAKCKTQNLNA